MFRLLITNMAVNNANHLSIFAEQYIFKIIAPQFRTIYTHIFFYFAVCSSSINIEPIKPLSLLCHFKLNTGPFCWKQIGVKCTSKYKSLYLRQKRIRKLCLIGLCLHCSLHFKRLDWPVRPQLKQKP